MNKTKFALFAAALLIVGWLLFSGTQPTSASPLLGITLTPTRFVPNVTLTPVPPTSVPPTSVPPTLPPPAQSTPGFIIPVTGSDHVANVDGLISLGLVFVAAGLIAAGLAVRKH